MNLNSIPKGYERFLWDDFVIEKKSVHVYIHKEHKQVDHNGMILWRQPNTIESQINLKAIEDAFNASEQQLASEIEKLKDKLTKDAVAGIIQLDPSDYHTLIVNPAKKDLAKFRAELQTIYDKGRALVVDELEQQGALDADNEFDIEDDDETLDEIAAVTASRLANDVQSRVAGIAATLIALGIAGALLKDRILEAISKLSDAYVGAAASLAGHVALNLGRDAAGEFNAGIVKEVYYSSVLDQNTCIPCQDADGETSENESNLPSAPNPECEGRGRCRCIHVFVFNTEKKGGAGSGNFGHAGRPGLIGGSSRSGSATSKIPEKILFHGTSREAIDKILMNGLIAGAGRGGDAWLIQNNPFAYQAYHLGDRDVAIYMSPDKEHAEQYAELASEITDSDPVLLKIRIPKEEASKLEEDDQDELGLRFCCKIPPEWIEGAAVLNNNTWVPYDVEKMAEQMMGGSKKESTDDRVVYVVILTKPQTKGGVGSGNFGHEGRPGLVGGSAPDSGAQSAPSIDPTALVVYHGTKDDLLKSIKEKGLIPGGGGQTFRTSESRYYVGDRAVSVFMSKSKKEALEYAKHAAFVHNEYYEFPVKPLLLKIAIPKDFQSQIITENDNPDIVRINTVVPPEWITPVDSDLKAKNDFVYAVILFDDEEDKGGAGSGNFAHSGRPGLVGGSSRSSRSERAKASYVPVTKAKRRSATKYENDVAKLVGGTLYGNNKPFDVQTDEYGLEIKTIFPGAKNPKITMHPESLARKVKEARVRKLKPATIVIDTRPSRAEFYFKPGVGSFRLSSMEKVEPQQLRGKLQ